MFRRAVHHAAIRSLPLLLLVVVAGCQQPDLAVSELRASASSTDVIEFVYTIENLDTERGTFRFGGPVKGPINVQAFTSSDGETLETPASAFFTPVLPTEVLEPGGVVHAEGVASSDIDLNARPYLILVIDPRIQRSDFDRLNNVYAVRVGDAPAVTTPVQPTQPPAVVAPIQPIKKPPSDVKVYPFEAGDAIAPEAKILEEYGDEVEAETGGKDAAPATLLDEDTGTGAGTDTGTDADADTDTGTDADTDAGTDTDTDAGTVPGTPLS